MPKTEAVSQKSYLGTFYLLKDCLGILKCSADSVLEKIQLKWPNVSKKTEKSNKDEKCSMVRLKKYCKEISRQCGVFGNVLWLGNGQPPGRTSKP